MDQKELREQAVRDAKCGLILDAAKAVFAQKGFWETRIEDIAAQAGFSKASLYNYYPDKETIFFSLAVREYERVLAEIESRLSQSNTVQQNLESMLLVVFTNFGEHFALVLSTANFQTMMAMHVNFEQKHKDPLVADKFREHVERIGSVLIRIIEWGREKGEVRTDLDNKVIARFIGGLIRGVILDWKVARQVGSPSDAAREVAQFVMKGLA